MIASVHCLNLKRQFRNIDLFMRLAFDYSHIYIFITFYTFDSDVNFDFIHFMQCNDNKWQRMGEGNQKLAQSQKQAIFTDRFGRDVK